MAIGQGGLEGERVEVGRGNWLREVGVLGRVCGVEKIENALGVSDLKNRGWGGIRTPVTFR